MGIGTAIAVYLVIWWVVLFAVLPWGVRVPEHQEGAGMAESAPIRPRLWLKALVTTVIAALLWLVVWYVASSEMISFRDGW